MPPARHARRKLRPLSADVSVPVDARLKKLWDEALASVRSAESRGASAFDELWEGAARIVEHDPPLYVIGGYASAREFFEQELREPERTARRMMRVARFATPREEARYGASVLDAALAYLEAKAGHALEGTLPVAFERLKIPVKDGKATKLVPLDRATVKDIAAATRALASRSRKGRAASATQQAIAASLGEHEILAHVVVHERDGFASFANVPVAAFGAFSQAVARVKTAGSKAAAKKKKKKRG